MCLVVYAFERGAIVPMALCSRGLEAPRCFGCSWSVCGAVCGVYSRLPELLGAGARSRLFFVV